MQTRFSAAQLSDPDIRDADAILRRCVHCGFCNATCPTFRLLGDEADGPRGRIYLIKDMLENERVPGPGIARHLDRCLSCLSCMSTCPSGVNYMHLVDHGRAYLEARLRRPWIERARRWLLASLLTRPRLLRAVMMLARPVSAVPGLVPAVLRPALQLSRNLPRQITSVGVPRTTEPRRGHVALFPGCVQQSLDNDVNLAAVRLLNRAGFEVTVLRNTACCGAVEHHLGHKSKSLARVRRNLAAWNRQRAARPFDRIVVTASGCGTMLKDYAHLLRSDKQFSEMAATFSSMTRDVTEFLCENLDAGAVPVNASDLLVACQVPCSMQHGQRIREQPAALLRQFGYRVTTPSDDFLCCGSAGTYNLLQPDIARELGQRKAETLRDCNADVVATGNLGCALQLRGHLEVPILHTVQLLDWASGGPRPGGLESESDSGSE